MIIHESRNVHVDFYDKGRERAFAAAFPRARTVFSLVFVLRTGCCGHCGCRVRRRRGLECCLRRLNGLAAGTEGATAKSNLRRAGGSNTTASTPSCCAPRAFAIGGLTGPWPRCSGMSCEGSQACFGRDGSRRLGTKVHMQSSDACVPGVASTECAGTGRLWTLVWVRRARSRAVVHTNRPLA